MSCARQFSPFLAQMRCCGRSIGQRRVCIQNLLVQLALGTAFLFGLYLVRLKVVPESGLLPERAVEQRVPVPKIVWSFWDTPQPPLIVQQIQQYNHRHLNGWTIHFLCGADLDAFLLPEDFPAGYGDLGPSHKADWVRLALVAAYGGVWLDASIIINDPNVLHRLADRTAAESSEFTGFSFRNGEADGPGGISMYVETWFIMAPPSSPVVLAWRDEFRRAILMGFRKYRDDLRSNGVKTELLFGKDIEATYFTPHACFQAAVQTRNYFPGSVPKMIIMHAEEDMFKLHTECSFSSKCVLEHIRDEPEQCRAIPYIKLIGFDRQASADIDISAFLSL